MNPRSQLRSGRTRSRPRAGGSPRLERRALRGDRKEKAGRSVPPRAPTGGSARRSLTTLTLRAALQHRHVGANHIALRSHASPRDQ